MKERQIKNLIVINIKHCIKIFTSIINNNDKNVQSNIVI